MATSAIKDNSLKNSRAFLENAVQICLGIVAVCLVYAAAMSVANSFRLARQPYQFDYEEGNVLNAAVRINDGLTPYAAPRSWPVVLNPYGPIPYFISALLIRSSEPQFFPPRMTSLVAALIVACEIGLLVRGFSGSMLLGISFGGFFLTIPLVQQWEPLLRVDMLGLALSLAGLVVFFRWPRGYLWSWLLFALALLCKVTFLAAPVACAAILIRRKQWRELGRGIMMAAAVLGPAVAALQWSTRGAFLFHQFGTHVDSFSWANYENYAAALLRQTPVLVALSAIGILRSRRLSEPSIYLLVAILGTATAVKRGSNSNHFLELEAALCILAAIGICELQKMKKFPAASAALVVLCVAILAAEGIGNRAAYSSRGVVDQCPQAYAYIRQHNQVLSENVGALVLTGRPVLLSNPFVYAQLVRKGKWPIGEVERMLQESRADLVIIGRPSIRDQRWSQPALAALDANYHVAQRFVCADATLAYEPNLRQVAPTQ